MLYKITNGTLSFGEREVLSHINFEVKGTEKIAIVGANGAGKTTLLRLIAGQLTLDRDDRRMEPGIWKSREFTVGMLEQAAKIPDVTVLQMRDSFLTHTSSSNQSGKTFNQLFLSLGFSKEDLRKRLPDFSGGEQTKIRLILLLLSHPDLLLLDEPTNHLDIPTTEWLEDYLRSYDGAVVMVSHDRFFLDRTADVVYELSHGRLTRYAGNYTAYREQKQKDIAAQKKAYENQQAEIARLEDLIEKFKHKPKKAAFARSRATMLRRMEHIEPPEEDDAHIFTGELTLPTPGSKWPLETDYLQIGYDRDHALLEITLRVRRGQKIGIIGSNGIGKSTFLKTVIGEIAPLKGKFSLGNGDLLGYFDQHTASISSDQTVLEHFRAQFPQMTEQELRKTLASYLFTGADTAKSINRLSGGEKSRLMLAELLTRRPHLLLLDEPTNHMDIHVKETLESAFRAYSGTILFISHDRYFISHVADALLVFDETGVSYDPFGYEHYLEKRRTEGASTAMLRAEDAALRESFAAVPRREYHEAAPLSDEEAYRSWQLDLAAEPLNEARQRVEELITAVEEAALQYEESYWNSWAEAQNSLSIATQDSADVAETDSACTTTQDSMYRTEQDSAFTIRQNLQALQTQLADAWNDWTAACLSWEEKISQLQLW